MSQRNTTFTLTGGEDHATPAIALQPGALTFSKNYEMTAAGTRRIDGHERFDGRPKPSEAGYWVLHFDAGTTLVNVADIIDGATSAASGEVLVVTVSSGDWATNDAAGYLILFNVTGTYQDNEFLMVGAGSVATANGLAVRSGASNDTDHNTWWQAAIEATRLDIAAVPGSGPLRGVESYGGATYAVRDNAGGTAGVLHKSSVAGWQAVDLGRYVSYTAGMLEIFAGETITGGTSGATGVVVAVIVESGDWSTNDAAGVIYLRSVTGTFQAEAITSATGAATCSGAQTANGLPVGGRYEFALSNFKAGGAFTLYGVNGVGRGFMFDGSGFAFFHTGMPIAKDKPEHIFTHKLHLFVSIDGHAMHSGTGAPMDWRAITGAAEVTPSDAVTAFDRAPGGLLVLFCRNSTHLLYGSSSADWDLREHSAESGAIEWSSANVGEPVYLDDQGLRQLSATQAYGDMKANTISKQIDAVLLPKKSLVTAALRCKAKDQYRIFFSDGTGIYVWLGGKGIQPTRVDFAIPVRCCCSAEDASGNEVMFFGSDDGYVYQLDVGTSFDGAEVEALIRLPFYRAGYPSNAKAWKRAVVEIDAPLGAALTFMTEMDYSSTERPTPVAQTFDVRSGGGVWGGAIWGEFAWGTQIVGQAEAYLDGSSISIALIIRSNATYELPHTLSAVQFFFIPRGRQR